MSTSKTPQVTPTGGRFDNVTPAGAVLGGVLAVLLVAVGVTVLMVVPRLRAIEQLEVQLHTTKAEDSASRAAASAADLERDWGRLTPQLSGLVPAGRGAAKLFEDLTRAAEAQGLRVVACKMEGGLDLLGRGGELEGPGRALSLEVSPLEIVHWLPVQLVVRGTYRAYTAFVVALSKYERLLVVRSMLARPDAGDLLVDLSLEAAYR